MEAEGFRKEIERREQAARGAKPPPTPDVNPLDALIRREVEKREALDRAARIRPRVALEMSADPGGVSYVLAHPDGSTRSVRVSANFPRDDVPRDLDAIEACAEEEAEHFMQFMADRAHAHAIDRP
jgi:hypothetical protein